MAKYADNKSSSDKFTIRLCIYSIENQQINRFILNIEVHLSKYLEKFQ
jgi:hypothetical protein